MSYLRWHQDIKHNALCSSLLSPKVSLPAGRVGGGRTRIIKTGLRDGSTGQTTYYYVVALQSWYEVVSVGNARWFLCQGLQAQIALTATIDRAILRGSNSIGYQEVLPTVCRHVLDLERKYN